SKMTFPLLKTYHSRFVNPNIVIWRWYLWRKTHVPKAQNLRLIFIEKHFWPIRPADEIYNGKQLTACAAYGKACLALPGKPL
ncbi:MAG: hypothetical protein DMF76_25095, partial [Acidobacteria bacterium]